MSKMKSHKDVSYSGIHKWISYHYEKSGTCSECKTSNLSGKYIHWANISGEYKRDIKDWKELCAKCHQKFDKRYKIGNLIFAICLECEEPFNISPSRVGKTPYCSRTCFANYRKGMAKSDFWKLTMEVF